ncbi:SET domain-containing protein SmydA-8-like [Planococcus citri]|uniref:SET domain-containing protein SmydA-8-like n=1 Tax=Planococcus citri TaxID=170843 RepID=UPI0031F79B19
MLEILQNNDKCWICDNTSSKKCSACKQINYCSIEHQKSDWKRHKKNCKPCMVKNDRKKGRCLVTTRDIAPNEIIFDEEPLVLGPRNVSPDPVCLGCHMPVSPISSPKCEKCGWPICGTKCAGLETTHRAECDILSAGRNNVENNYMYELILPLRCILLKKNDPEKWNILINMESHLNKRTPGTEAFKEIEIIHKYLEDNFMANTTENEKISQDDFHKVCGVIEVNSLDVPFDVAELSALYPTFSLLEHDCSPNIKISFNKQNVIVRSATSIKSDQNLSTMYTNTIWGTQMRQRHLFNTKYFICECQRCKDPTELGTNFSSLKCLQDNCNSYLLPEDPLNLETTWKCNKCNSALSTFDVEDILSRIGYEVEKILEEINPNVQSVEMVLEKILSVLHPHHYYCFSIKHSLIQLYGNQVQYAALDHKILTRKIEYCKELLSTLSKLDSTGSRAPLYVAILNNELSSAILETMKRRLSETLDLSAIQDDAKEAKKLITKAILLLNEEPNSRINLQLIQSCKNVFKEIEETLKGEHIS